MQEKQPLITICMTMKPKHVPRARRLISSRDYSEKRICQLARRMIHNAEKFCKYCDFSPFASLLYNREQAILRKKINWYEQKIKI